MCLMKQLRINFRDCFFVPFFIHKCFRDPAGKTAMLKANNYLFIFQVQTCNILQVLVVS